MPSFPFFIDGSYPVPFEVSPAATVYPFKNNPAADIATRQIKRYFNQDASAFAPGTANRTAARNLLASELVTATRSGATATYFDSTGKLQVAAANTPRFDYDPVTLSFRGLLIEGARTNYLLNSGDLTATGWSQNYSGTGLAPTRTGGLVGPFGLSATRIQANRGVGNTNSDLAYVIQSVSGFINPHAVSTSFWAKSNTGLPQSVWIDTGNGASSTSITVTPQWQRFVLSNPAVADTNERIIIGTRGAVNTTASVDILVAGCQLEVGDFASSYIPTTTVAVTRNVDLITSTPSWWNAGDWSIVCEFSTQATAADFPIAFTAEALGSYIFYAGEYVDGSARIYCGSVISGSPVVGAQRWAIGYAATGATSFSQNGGNVAVAALGTPGVPDTFRIGTLNSSGSNNLNGWLKTLLYFPSKLSDTALQCYGGSARGIDPASEWASSSARSFPDNDILSPSSFDAYAYLVDESDTELSGNKALVAFTRTYSRVPVIQTIPTSVSLSRPSLPNGVTLPAQIGAYVLAQPLPNVAKFDAYVPQKVASDSGATTYFPTGGTYTLTVGANTTGALAYNASAATIQTALNALSAVSTRGGCTVSTGSPVEAGSVITFAAIPSFTITSSITQTGPGSPQVQNPGTAGSTNGGYTQVAGVQPTSGSTNGGTFTITILGQTTAAIAYNATAAQIQTALNALSNVTAYGGCIVTPAYTAPTPDVFQFTVTFSGPTVSCNPASLAPSPCSATITRWAGVGQVQYVDLRAPTALRTLYCPAPHGLTAADTIYIRSASGYFVGIAGTFSLPDSNTVQLTVTSTMPYASTGAITEVGKRTRAAYTPGSAVVRASKQSQFFLPGVTAGIATSADIPVSLLQTDNDTFLQTVFSGTGSVNVSVTEQPWRGPIIEVDTTSVKVADI